MKKVLKKIGKFFAVFFGCIFGFLALCVVVTLCWGGVQMSKGSVTDALPEVPADFVPEIRFAVFTDSHNRNDRVGEAIDEMYRQFDNDETYKGIDAVFGLGDFSSIGEEKDYEAFVQALDEHIREGTKIVNILGNHEMKNKNATEYFKKYFGYDPNTVTEINGFTFIGFSGSPHITEWTFSVKDLKWAAAQLKAAEKTAGDKPIFVMQHPHNFGTVYGSAVWCSPQLNPVLAGHNKVVDFSGHSHFPMNDPRSINQTTYTSVGVGAMARFELDKNYIVGQHPDGYDTAEQLCIVEANSSGSVRIRGFDVASKTFFCDWFIENVNDAGTYAYTYKNVKAHDSVPVFSENTAAQAQKNENGEWVLSFDEAEDNYIVHHYNITIKDASGKKVFGDTFIDDYFVIDGDSTADFRIPGETLTAGKEYTAEIVAVSAYHLKSETVKLRFTPEE